MMQAAAGSPLRLLHRPQLRSDCGAPPHRLNSAQGQAALGAGQAEQGNLQAVCTTCSLALERSPFLR